MLSALLVDINLFVDRFLASGFEVGGISAINYASRLTAIFDTMIVVGVGVVLLPMLSQLNVEGNREGFKKISVTVLKWTVIILLPLAIISMIFSQEMIDVIYKRGEFGMDSVLIVSVLFFCYAPQILFIPLNIIIFRFFHSLEDTKTPMYCSAASVVLNIVLSVLLSYRYGLQGIAAATSIAALTNTILLLFFMKRNVGWNKDIFGIKEVLKILLSVSLLIMILLYTKSLNYSSIWHILSIFSGGTLYVFLIIALMKKDFKYLIILFKSKT